MSTSNTRTEMALGIPEFVKKDAELAVGALEEIVGRKGNPEPLVYLFMVKVRELLEGRGHTTDVTAVMKIETEKSTSTVVGLRHTLNDEQKAEYNAFLLDTVRRLATKMFAVKESSLKTSHSTDDNTRRPRHISETELEELVGLNEKNIDPAKEWFRKFQ